MSESTQHDPTTIGVWGGVITTVLAALGGFWIGLKKQWRSEKDVEDIRADTSYKSQIDMLKQQVEKYEVHLLSCEEKHLEAAKEAAAIRGQLVVLEQHVKDCREDRDGLRQRISILESKL